MAKVPPPKKSAKGVPPPPVKTAGNLDKPEPAGVVNLNLKVSPEFHKAFKVYAAMQGKQMNELVQEAFQALKERNGDS